MCSAYFLINQKGYLFAFETAKPKILGLSTLLFCRMLLTLCKPSRCSQCHLGSLKKNETYWPETERLVPWKQLALFRINKHFMDENSFEAKVRSQRPFMLVSLISRGCDVPFEGSAVTLTWKSHLSVKRTSRLFDKCIICLFTPQLKYTLAGPAWKLQCFGVISATVWRFSK